ncbi:MAG: hypothetical protein MUP45_03320 [Candidatus Marinimicrobia bacterium]|nr:hypothetical protein [Candidatus Neomarinimicrobiota bacterium]
MKKNWQLLLIILATVILGIIAVVTAIKLAQIGREPIAPTAPTSEPRAGGDVPTEACTSNFNVSEIPPGCYEECQIDGEDCPGEYVCQDVDGTNLCVNQGCSDEEDCICPSPSPIECYDECETTPDCPEELICKDINGTNLCVNNECSDENDCVCSIPPDCYDECTSNTDCAGDLVCRDINGTNLCVNTECPRENDCTCPAPGVSPSPSPRVSPTPGVELPEAGIISPTLLATLGGIILILIGLFL